MRNYIKSAILVLLTVFGVQVHANTNVSKDAKQDLVELFQFFQDGCGYGNNFSTSKKQLKLFKDSFIGYSDNYYVKPSSNLPSKYRKSVKDIKLIEDDREVMHYIVSFKNATYRGYDLEKLDVSFIPGSEYGYHDRLYFKDAGFLKSKPSVKFAGMGSGWSQNEFDQGFNREKLSITCGAMPI